jgi:hypothetical protein
LAKYCFNCHSEKRAEADIDLAQYAKLGDLRKATRVWQKVAEMLEGGQMPPKQAKQPTDPERTQMRDWLRAFLKAEAKAHAGDPGRVTMRRLSNAEYTYTIHDLTGVPTLHPTKEFPIDGAAGEGFTNSGDALVMSRPMLSCCPMAFGSRRPQADAIGRTKRSPRFVPSMRSTPCRGR